MQTLLPTLLNYDSGMLAIIAHRWDVDLESGDKRDDATALAKAMLDPDRAAAEWKRLDDTERGALQTLLGAPEHKMPAAQFSRLFGEVRQMGPGRRDREKPHLNPANIAETLYYRGLIALAYDQGKVAMQTFVYVPDDLAAVLPVHHTGFDLDAQVDTSTSLHVDEEFEPEQATLANTTLVDDLTTLLVYLQITEVSSVRPALYAEIAASLAPHWLTPRSTEAVALLTGLVGSMGLAADDEGVFKLVPEQAKRWLDDTRPRQVRALAEAWCSSTLYNDLWHTPGLDLENTGWRNDPLLARQTALTFLEMAPPESWWPLGDLIALVKAEDPDFQRPGGDYSSWYIRDAQTGEYLHGFENWERVDGAVLRFIFTGPLHWLGLIDVGDEGTLCRLTPYGRALIGAAEWPDPEEDRPPLDVDDGGTLRARRTLSRYERFQLARIAEWESPGDPYVYRLTAASLQRATGQGLQVGMIAGFLRRASGRDTLPRSVQQLLERWSETGSADVWLTRAVVLRTATPDMLQTILETPELRRYVGAQLGPDSVLVRAGQEHDLTAALNQHGIPVTFDD